MMFSPIIFDFGELDSIVIAHIVGVHITLSSNVQRMIKLAINTLVCIDKVAKAPNNNSIYNIAVVSSNANLL